jgi:hypothetical protein
MMGKMLSNNLVSPRTYQHKKIELERWLAKEKAEIKRAEKAIEKG